MVFKNNKGIAIEMAIGFATLMFLFSIMISVACFSSARVNNIFLYKQKERLFIDNIYEKEVNNLILGIDANNVYEFEYGKSSKEFKSVTTNDGSKYTLIVFEVLDNKEVLECQFVIEGERPIIMKWIYM